MDDLLETPAFDDMLDSLVAVQRRRLLFALLDHNPQDDSPFYLADSDSDDDALELIVTMNHVHLPKLDDYGFIEWDEESHEVAKGPNFEDIRPLLELLDDHRDELPSHWF